jgi:phosphoglycerate dehydrogenase-like enzyme
MPLPNVLVVAPPDHYALRSLAPLRNSVDLSIGGTIDFVAQHGPQAEVVLYTGWGGAKLVPFSEVWPRLERVKWVHSLSAGVEKLLVPSFIESPVPLTNARGVYKRSLADFCITGILYFYKHVRRLIEAQRAHKWEAFDVDWVADKVMGVVGYGEIGRECATLAKGLGLKIHATRRNPELSSNDPLLERVFPSSQLKEMLSEVDVVLAAAPLTPQTNHMLSDAEFAVMKPSAIVINVGRGPVIDEAALVRALQNKKIRGAALDVFEVEPLAADSPLWDMENVLISPHCTDHTANPDWMELSVQFFVQNFGRFQNGEMLENLVDKKAGY